MKGQFLRVFLQYALNDSMVLALAKGLTFHMSAQLEEDTTKDDGGSSLWITYSVTGISCDIQMDALLGSGTGADEGEAHRPGAILDFANDTKLAWKLAVVNGDENRTISSLIASGNGKISSVTLAGQVGQKATYKATLNNYGTITVAS